MSTKEILSRSVIILSVRSLLPDFIVLTLTTPDFHKASIFLLAFICV